MARCLGFPWCTDLVLNDNITCNKCWNVISRHKEGRHLRSEFLALNKNFKGTQICKEAESKLEEFLKGRLSWGARRKENVKRFTIVGG